jgi:hypothetical protein
LLGFGTDRSFTGNFVRYEVLLGRILFDRDEYGLRRAVLYGLLL